ncbi:hypothetical protein HanXRQr2_Chr02g0071071 [Helianthus annuus]|uniref:Uncharacterized protein n=1 Tax=Helianthus annuus TaxID=4232 RepID=A0A9K3NZZ6_HELAN|nr:hypothetical protein HanXRQr2_Chr02g0071071 [Helianthus annuus]KAJ0605094.1 hypothetical protein HanHA300_Chr02g0059091 [Helianthus annuus]KAJ0619112.1 hypothetical protein HanHA89_Chr02g0067641 [Helianthus annuus]KAJ0777560.1 hypothetical protein HanLR1_Chr02g0061831 [Helianthus annuus]KAJ0786594.1 hypothetical protein HanOQP8_Chr02g0073011 [Helianthus annuus]
MRPKITVIPPKTIVAEGKSGEVEKTVAKETDAAKVWKALEVTKASKFVKVTGGDLPVIEHTDPKAQVENPTAQHTGPIQTDTVKSTTGESAGGVHTGGGVKNVTAGGGNTGGSGVDTRKGASEKRPRQPSSIRDEDTLGDIYYKTYDESRTNELHTPVWSLKQGDTFAEFGACREWMMWAFPQADIKLQEDRATFHKEKKSEEWGLQGLKKKLQASEDLLAEERRNWRVPCDNDNKKMYAARTKITNLEAQVKELKKSEASYKEKYEEAKSHRERVEVDLSPQILRKDRDLAGKDTEIAKLKRQLREAQEGLEAEKQKTESLEVDLIAEKVKAETAEEARKVSMRP